MDALRSTLAKHPGIQLQEQQVKLNEGILRVASGQFDTTLNASMSQGYTSTPLTAAQQAQYALLGLSTEYLDATTTTYTVSAQKLFRNGIIIEPTITLNRNTDNLATRLGLNQSQLSFQVVLPFLRGRGRAAVDAQELSAASIVNASLHDANETVAQLLANTAISYWNAVAAVQNLKIAKGSEARGADYVRDVQTLIEADKIPKGEIYQLLANLGGRTASRIAAEQGVINAQQSLALALGLEADEVIISPDASDPLPDWPEKSIPEVSPEIVRKFVKYALDKRPDVIAAKLRRQSAEQILPAARNQLRPQLNLTLNGGYNGLLEGAGYGRPFGALVNNVGVTTYASLNFSFPPRNDVAIGQLAQANASYQQSILNVTELERTTASNVVTALTTLSSSIDALQKAREAVSYYRIALDQELERFRLGLGSLVDVLTIEDRLTSALSGEVSAQLNYAVAIENLRLVTGTIVDPNERSHTIDKNTFIRPPFESELQ
ncbi:MAG TPA: TolC family protein [Terriglobales bacterium]